MKCLKIHDCYLCSIFYLFTYNFKGAELYCRAEVAKFDGKIDHLTTPYTDLTFYILHFALIFIIYALVICHIYIPSCCSKHQRFYTHRSSSKRKTVYYTICEHMYPYKYCCNNNVNNNCCNILCFLCIPHSLTINHEHKYNNCYENHPKIVKKQPIKSLHTVCNEKKSVELVFHASTELNATPIAADFDIHADDNSPYKSPYHKTDILSMILYPTNKNKEEIPSSKVILPLINVQNTPPPINTIATAMDATDNWLYNDKNIAETPKIFSGSSSSSLSVSQNTAKLYRNITPSAYSLGVSLDGRSNNKGSTIYSYTGLKTNNLTENQIAIKLSEMNADGKKLNKKGKPKARKVHETVNAAQEAVNDNNFHIDVLEQSVEIFDREIPDVTSIRIHVSYLYNFYKILENEFLVF